MFFSYLKSINSFFLAAVFFTIIAVFCATAAVFDIFSAAGEFFFIALMNLNMVYFFILSENWFSGRPVQTRGGVVNKQTSPVIYTVVHLILLGAGLVALLLFLIGLLDCFGFWGLAKELKVPVTGLDGYLVPRPNASGGVTLVPYSWYFMGFTGSPGKYVTATPR